MADLPDEDEYRPLPPREPGQPLPRKRFSLPEPEDDPPPRKKPKGDAKGRSKDKPKKAARKDAGDGDDEKKGVLIEETPELDTYDTRRKLRLVIGAVAVGLLSLIFLFVYRAFSGGEAEPEVAEAAPAGPARNPAAEALRLENEATVALDDARRVARNGDAEKSLQRLKNLLEAYPKSHAATEAREAIDRAEQGLPIFPDGPALVAKRSETPAPEVPSVPVVVAVPPGPTAAPGATTVELVPPATPPEPFKETGLTFANAGVAARTPPTGFRARPQAGLHLSGWPWEITCDKDGSAMRLIPGGTFLMGRDDGPLAERPAHRVTLGSYYIDQHEVTYKQYIVFKGTGSDARASRSETSDDSPAVHVSARDAKAYAEWAGKRLPTEAQWEMAARTVDGRLWPWGTGIPNWGRPRKPGQIDPVMSFPLDLSPYGVFDMAGNASEWTSDWFDPRYYQQFRSTDAVEPLGPAHPKAKLPTYVIKGGSKTWETSWRDGMRPEAHLPALGFRCVLPVEAAAMTQPSPAAAPAGARPAAPGGSVPF